MDPRIKPGKGQWRRGQRVMCRGGYEHPRCLGTVLGASVSIGGVEWVPVLWDELTVGDAWAMDVDTQLPEDEDPSWFLAAELSREVKRRRKT